MAVVCPACKTETPANVDSCRLCGESLRPRSPDQAHSSGSRDVSTAPLEATVAFDRPSPPVSLDLEPGSDFGSRYRIERLLGAGGMGKVYLAYDREIDRKVALKLVRPEYASEPKMMARFRQELQLASRVSHRNIVRIHDLGDVQGVKFISMAYIDGVDLHEIVCNEGRLSFPRVLDIARQLCAALDAAHSEGVVHRDLKPRNILVDRIGHVCISDFGLAKSIYEDSAASITRTNEFLGTPLYMSPEQIEAQDVDHRSDLYSLGLILYEIVTGDLPFSGRSSLQVMHSRMTQAPKDPKVLVPDLPDWFTAIIAKCLAKDPKMRYQSASEILRDLDAGKAPKRSFKDRLPRPSRTWALVAASALIAACVTVAIPALRERIFSHNAGSAPATYLAVLPFKPLGDSPELKYRSEGVVEALGAKLFSLKEVHLISPSVVDRANKSVPLDQLARDLGANLLLHGTVQLASGHLELVVSLWDAAKKNEIWRKSFECLPDSLLATEDNIYNALVDKLDVKLSDAEVARGAARPTEDSAAYDLYLRGRSLMRGKADVATYTSALALFDSAIAKDYRFARAYAGMAEGNFALYRLTKDPSWMQKGVAAAQHAEDLDRQLPEVHLAAGIAYFDTGKTPEAIAEFRQAIALAPNSDDSYRRLGSAYLRIGKLDLALENYGKAVQINPYNWRNYNQLGAAYLKIHDRPKALAAFQRVTQLQPDYAGGYANMGYVYYTSGDWDKCGPQFRKALELQKSTENYRNLGVFTLYSGKAAEAVQLLEQAALLGRDDQLNFSNLGDAYFVTGQTDKAVSAYKKAIDLAYRAFRLNPKDGPMLSSIAVNYAKTGDTQQAETFIHRARAIDPSDNQIAYGEAIVEQLAGHTGEALKALGESIKLGYPARVAAHEPYFKSLGANPEFQKLTAARG
ncbi:MAG: hypothetical protein JWO80_3859 [Bryobacterales bacterium]|nr:hypothetical protein [Bryobacterales bacterium]